VFATYFHALDECGPATETLCRGLEAVANARALLGAHSAAERVEVETRIDANAALRALLI
jgi:hypothetical protein